MEFKQVVARRELIWPHEGKEGRQLGSGPAKLCVRRYVNIFRPVTEAAARRSCLLTAKSYWAHMLTLI